MRIDISTIVNNSYYDLDILEPVLDCKDPINEIKLAELISFCAYGIWHSDITDINNSDKQVYTNCMYELLFLGSNELRKVLP